MSKIIPTEEKLRSADIVNTAVKEVNDRFPDWQPTPTMLGYARAVASAAAEALASHALASRIEGARAIAKAAEDVLGYREGELPERGWLRDNDGSRRALDNLATAIRTLPTTIAGGQ